MKRLREKQVKSNLTRLGPTRLRVLGVLLDRAARGQPSTLQNLEDCLGIYRNAVANHISGLQAAGLVTCEPILKSTLRPTCTITLESS